MCGAPVGATGDVFISIGFPVFHVEGVGNDPRAGLEIENLWAQFKIDAWQQEHRDHLSLGEITLEQVGLHKGSFVANAFFGRVALRKLNHLGIVFDAERLGSVLRSGDDRAAIAGAEIDHVVFRRHLGHLQHFVDQCLRRRYPDDVFTGLAYLGLIILVAARLRERPRARWTARAQKL